MWNLPDLLVFRDWNGYLDQGHSAEAGRINSEDRAEGEKQERSVSIGANQQSPNPRNGRMIFIINIITLL